MEKFICQVGLSICGVLIVVSFYLLLVRMVEFVQYERDMHSWVESLEFNQNLKATQGFYKGQEFQITSLNPIRLSGPVELILYKQQAYEMFREVTVERRDE